MPLLQWVDKSGQRRRALRPGERRVAVVQLGFTRLPHLEAVREHLMAGVLAAARTKPSLVVLPAWTGLLPLHLYTSGRKAQGWEEAIRRYGTALEEWWLGWAREMARQIRVHLVPGSVLVPSHLGRGLLHTSVLVDSRGRIKGRVYQTHVTGREAAWGLMGGAELPVWDVDGIRLGIALGSDLWYPEVGRILSLQGATLLVAPTAVASPYSPWHQMAGAWQQAQGSQVFVVEAALCGEVDGQKMEGRSAIAGPAEITPGGRGFYRRAADPGQPGILAAELHFPRLYRLRREYPMADHFNPALYEKHFPGQYARHQMGRGGPVPIGIDEEQPEAGVMLW